MTSARRQKPPKNAIKSSSSRASTTVQPSRPRAYTSSASKARRRTRADGSMVKMVGPAKRPVAPSIKPTGPLPSPTEQQGSDGVGGYGAIWFSGGETNPALIGPQLWRTYGETLANATIVAAATRYSLNLIGAVEWEAIPNPACLDVALAKKCAETAKAAVLDADMSQPFSMHAKKQALSGWYGFALHNWFWRKRSDGLIVISDLRHRPQATVARWDIPVEGEPWIGVEQHTRQGGNYYVERSRLWYTADLSITDRPQGVGLLRHVVEHARRLHALEEIEGFGFSANLRGVPIGRAPLGALWNYAKTKLGMTDEDADAYVEEQTEQLAGMLTNHSVSPDQGMLLDSVTYEQKASDGTKTFTTVPKWAIDLLQGGAMGLEEASNAIERITREMARVMSFEWALLGEGDAGSNAMHVDKTRQYGSFLNALTSGLGFTLRNDVVRPIIAANHGAQAAEEATPLIVPSTISTEDIRSFTGAILDLKQAGSYMPPDDPIFATARKRMNAPPPQKIPDALRGAMNRPPMLPGAPMPPSPFGGAVPPNDPKPGKLPPRDEAQIDPATDTGQLRQGGDSNTDGTGKRRPRKAA